MPLQQSAFELHGQVLALARQTPSSQTSPLVQARPSSQAVPFSLRGFEHTPVVGSQVPGRWQLSSAAQVTMELGSPQVPAWQVSPLVQRLPSLQEVPSGAGS